jgi:diacylglycerol kinase family enzyme
VSELRTPIYINPRAGTLRSPGPAAVAAALARAGVPAELHTVSPEGLTSALLRAAGEHVPVVGVCGGDGTLRTAAGILAGSETALAVLPTGTLNHFAQRIGIASLDDAVAALSGLHTAAVGIGTVNDEVFLNTAVFGEYVRVVRRRERWRRSIGRWPAAGLAFMAVLARARPLDATISMSDVARRQLTPMLWVGVGRNTFPRVAWKDVKERAGAEDLEVVLARTDARLARLRILTQVVMSLREPAAAAKHPRLLEILHTRSLRATARHDIDATLDGEIVRFGPAVDVRLNDRLLKVVVPG